MNYQQNKTCSECGQTKSITEFHSQKRGKLGVRGDCKACHTATKRAWYQDNKQHDKNSQLLFKYNISLEQYNTILVSQNNGCAICGTQKPSCSREYFAVDHCHKTGKVRGLLCDLCNRGLGLFKDSSTLIASALNYINRNDLPTE